MRGALWSLFFLLAIGTCAQEGRNEIGMRAYGGFIALHRPSLAILVDEHAKGLDVFYERAFSGEKQWHREYAYPSWGLNLLYMDMGSELLGSTVRLVPYLKLPLYSHNTFSLDLRVGWGIGWIQHSFDRTDNYKELAIGSQINGAVQLGLEASKRINNISVGAGIAIDHQSNGAFATPNLGVNVPSVNVSLRKHFGEARTFSTVEDDLEFDCAHTWAVRVGAGVHEAGLPLGPKHAAYNLSALWIKPFSFKSEVSGGIDLISKTTLPSYDKELIGSSRAAQLQTGVHIGYGINFGELALIFENGFYVTTPSRVEGSLYHRIGVRKNFGERWFANMILKTHYAVADYFEWGGGIRL